MSAKRPVPVALLIFLGETFSLAAQAVIVVLKGRLNLRNTLHQMASIGVDSIPIVVATSLSTGAVVAFYTVDVFVRYGAANLVGGTLTYTFLNELGPLLAGITVASRSGAAIAAEIGSMAVTEQVDALRALAVSPVRYLVAPRLAACLLMMPILGLFSDLVGVVGGYAMSSVRGVPLQMFVESARNFVTERDLVAGLVKTVIFGALIAIVACRQGLGTQGGATGVGRSTTASVVICVVLIFVSDFFLAQMLAPAVRIR
jgi:phospholipid/cholesterol/gamma-HCH transport system permease protein